MFRKCELSFGEVDYLTAERIIQTETHPQYRHYVVEHPDEEVEEDEEEEEEEEDEDEDEEEEREEERDE